ncbi:MAG: nuclear transport factor 2 family protein [Actinobacteria bacterium]|nr:nuclear transport factor 2 family protein [Actinomycetota bacterium]
MTIDVIETTRRASEGLSRDDLDAFLELVDPEVEFNSLVAEADTGVFRGHQGVREWWAMLKGSLGGVRFDPVEAIPTEHDRVAIAKIRVVGEVSGVEIGQDMWQVIYSPEGLAVWWGVFRTVQEAREEGLRQAAERSSGA